MILIYIWINIAFLINIIYKHSLIIVDIVINIITIRVSLDVSSMLNIDAIISPQINPKTIKERLLNFFFFFTSAGYVLYLFLICLRYFIFFIHLTAMKIPRI